MSHSNPWSVQAIIDRIEAERPQGAGSARVRKSWVERLRRSVFGSGTVFFGGRHAMR